MIQSLFGVFYSTEIIPWDLEELKDIAFELQDRSPGLLISNEGGWQSAEALFDPRFRAFVDTIEQHAQTMYSQLGYNDQRKVAVTSMWININGKGHYNMPHIHGVGLFSGVYYVETPENCGDLILENPITGAVLTMNLSHQTCNTAWNQLSHYEKAQAGKLFVFPTYVSHYTQPNKSDRPRISIAFNFNLDQEQSRAQWPAA
jgi:uncharacterized protein (TIGR02466 family)